MEAAKANSHSNNAWTVPVLANLCCDSCKFDCQVYPAGGLLKTGHPTLLWELADDNSITVWRRRFHLSLSLMIYMITSYLKAYFTLTFITARRARALFLLSAVQGVKQCVLTRKRMRVPPSTIYFLLHLLQGLVAEEYLLFASSTEPDTNRLSMIQLLILRATRSRQLNG